MSLTIGLSRGSGSPKYDNYWQWLRSFDPDVQIVDLFVSEDFEADLPKLDALILTGGGDIHPDVYGMAEYADRCDGVDIRRDQMELKAMEYAEENKLPVLGICRGIQLVNVYKNGTLVPHIPDQFGLEEYHTSDQGGDKEHSVEIEPGSILFRTLNQADGSVNSAHHQGVAELGQGLTVSARSSDGMIEALEWQEPEQSSFMLAVQWHPERMNPDSPLSRRLLERIFLEAESARILKATTPPLPKEEPEELPLPEPDKDDDNDSMFPIVQG